MEMNVNSYKMRSLGDSIYEINKNMFLSNIIEEKNIFYNGITAAKESLIQMHNEELDISKFDYELLMNLLDSIENVIDNEELCNQLDEFNIFSNGLLYSFNHIIDLLIKYYW